MEEKITAWISRDSNGDLYFHGNKPYKEGDWWINNEVVCKITNNLFPQVKWEDEEPTKVELTIKICE